MDTCEDPSLLEYARFYNIACDSAEIDPSAYIDDAGEADAETPPLHPEASEVRINVEHLLREKLDVTKEAACFLASVVRDSQTEKIDLDWSQDLPPLQTASDLKVAVPITTLDNDPDSLNQQPPERYEENDFSQLLDESCLDDQDMPIPNSVPYYGQNIMEQFTREKLNCTKDSFIMLQNVKRGCELSREEVDDLLQSMIPSSKIPTRESTPFFITPAHDIDDIDLDNPRLPPCDQPFSDSMNPQVPEGAHTPECLPQEMDTDIPSSPSEYPLEDVSLVSLPSTFDPNLTDVTSPVDTRVQNEPSLHCSSHIKRGSKRKPEDYSLSPSMKRNGETFSSRFSSLGSLKSFMESRGRLDQCPVTQSPYFTTKSSDEVHDGQTYSKTTAITRFGNQAIPKCTHKFPKIQRAPLQACIFVSTSLLKSHLRLIQQLDTAENGLRIIYRDYSSSIQGTTTSNDLPNEADMIITPTVGIILTTSQATTQLYLPGHKPTDLGRCVAESITSPLRERVYQLASRYESLYVVICHNAPSPVEKPATWTADKRTLGSLTELTAFCHSLSTISTVVPLMLPSSPETVAEWILALVQKHTDQTHSGRPGCHFPHQLGDIEFQDEESLWELFLRRVGLNPYAAQAVLTGLNGKQASRRPIEDFAQEQGMRSSLSTFVEMSTEERRALFQDSIGARTLEHIDTIVGKDWHCDWALNFDN